ncbi:MAG: hypothetical protein WC822_01560 [Candidatus Paceibacterota bacterium]
MACIVWDDGTFGIDSVADFTIGVDGDAVAYGGDTEQLIFSLCEPVLFSAPVKLKNRNGADISTSLAVTAIKKTPEITLTGSFSWTELLGATPASKTLNIANSGEAGSVLTWVLTLTLDAALTGKVTASSYSGTLAGGASVNVTISVLSTVAIGVHTGTISVAGTGCTTKTSAITTTIYKASGVVRATAWDAASYIVWGDAFGPAKSFNYTYIANPDTGWEVSSNEAAQNRMMWSGDGVGSPPAHRYWIYLSSGSYTLGYYKDADDGGIDPSGTYWHSSGLYYVTFSWES